MLHAKPLSFDDLILAVTVARQQLECGEWKRKEADAFMRDNGLSSEALRLLDGAELRFELSKAQKATRPTAQQSRLIMIDRENPARFEDAPLPPSWTRGCSISQHLDVIMHLLFLGVVKTTLTTLRDLLKQKSKNAPFMREVTLEWEALPQLPWLDLAPLTGENFGGWVGENFVALV